MNEKIYNIEGPALPEISALVINAPGEDDIEIECPNGKGIHFSEVNFLDCDVFSGIKMEVSDFENLLERCVAFGKAAYNEKLIA
jgi:hypothetical protein